MRYRNFDLFIQARDPSARTYGVFAQDADGASQFGALDLGAAWDRLQALCEAIEHRATALRAVESSRSFLPRPPMEPADDTRAETLGALLFATVFEGAIGGMLRQAMRTAAAQDAGLRVRLRLQEVPELHRLPWEFMHDGDDFVATSVRAPIVRYTESARAIEPLTVRGGLRMLIVAANPTDLEPLGVAAETQRLRASLADLEDAGDLEIDVLDNGRWDSLVEALSPGAGPRYHLLHFIGHGGVDPATGGGQLVFTTAEGRAAAQDAESVATLLKNHASLKLVVINACHGAATSANDTFSSVAAALVDRAVPAVIAMQFAITDRAAIDFSTAFYGLLARGNPVDTALTMTRVEEFSRPRAVDEPRSLEWATPVLYLRAADGALFERVDSDGEQRRPVRSELPDDMAPYRGLAHYEARHAPIFLGRDAETDALVERLRAGARLITVIAASGSGKSSLVRAGLVPRVRDDRSWVVAAMMPGKHACEALAMAVLKALPAAQGAHSFNRASIELAGDLGLACDRPAFAATLRRTVVGALPEGARLLLLIDQCEELFTLCDDAERAAFVANLVEVLGATNAPVHVILTLRADFTGRVLQTAGLAPRLEASAFFLQPMTSDQLRTVIETPARLAGYRFEPGLVEELVHQALGGPGNLPLLAFLLERLWAQRDERAGVLRWHGYRALGGLKGAIDAHAEAVVEGLPESGRARLSDLFCALVQPNWSAHDTRRRVPRHALDTLGPEARETVDALIDARLLTARYDANAERDEVEIAHEALIQAWARLRGWLDAEREWRLLREQIDRAEQVWATHQEAADDLLRGTLLTRAIELRDLGRPQLSERQRRFVDVSAIERDTAAMDARDRHRVSVARRWIEADPMIAALVLIECERPERSAPAMQLLFDLARQPGGLARMVSHAHGGALFHVEFSPDGRWLLTADDDGVAFLWRTDGRAPPVALEQGDLPLYDCAFSPDGACVALVCDEIVHVHHLDGVSEVVELVGHGACINSVAFSPDSQRVLTTSDDETARIWSVDGELLQLLDDHAGCLTSGSFSPSGDQLLIGGDAGVYRWRLDGAELTPTRIDHSEAISTAIFSPRGGRVLSVSDEGHWLWLSAGDDPDSLPTRLGAGSEPKSAVFSPNGRFLAATSAEGASLWAVGTGTAPFRRLNREDVEQVVFSPDSTRALITYGKLAEVWRLDAPDDPIVLRGHLDEVTSAAFHPDGWVVTGSDDRTVRVWSLDAPKPVVTLYDQGIESMVVSPDRTSVLMIDGDDRAYVFTFDGVERCAPIDAVRSAVFTADSACLIVASEDDNAVRKHPLDGSAPHVIVAPRDEGADDEPAPDDNCFSLLSRVLGSRPSDILSATPNAAGTHVLTVRHDKTVTLWSVDGGWPVELGADIESAVFSPDGGHVATFTDGTTRIWDLTGAKPPVEIDSAESEVAFSPSGDRVVFFGDEGAAIWPTDGVGAPIHLPGHPRGVEGVAFSACGQRLATASGDGTVRLWDAKGSEEAVVRGQSGPLNALSFSPDGGRLLALFDSDDDLVYPHTVSVWDITDPRQPVAFFLRGHDDRVRSATFSPDGAWILTCSDDGTARLWRVGTNDSPVVLRMNAVTIEDAAFGLNGTDVLTRTDAGAVHRWTLDGGTLQRMLDERIQSVLPPEFRVYSLGESVEHAREAVRRAKAKPGHLVRLMPPG